MKYIHMYITGERKVQKSITCMSFGNNVLIWWHYAKLIKSSLYDTG